MSHEVGDYGHSSTQSPLFLSKLSLGMGWALVALWGYSSVIYRAAINRIFS